MLFQIIFDDHPSFGNQLKVAQLFDEEGQDYTFLMDYDKAYLSLADIRADIAAQLKVDEAEVELEVV
ncbi:MAG: hypothetical protein ABFR97_11940 [Thermodesulfobacteriota bacterium]